MPKKILVFPFKSVDQLDQPPDQPRTWWLILWQGLRHVAAAVDHNLAQELEQDTTGMLRLIYLSWHWPYALVWPLALWLVLWHGVFFPPPAARPPQLAPQPQTVHAVISPPRVGHPPRFIYQAGSHHLVAPRAVFVTAARFSWLDALSGPHLNSQQILRHDIQPLVTPALYHQLTQSFQLPTAPQVWQSITVRPLAQTAPFSWSVQVQLAAKTAQGMPVSGTLNESVIKEGSGWAVSSVSFPSAGG